MGATTTPENMMGLETDFGGGTISTSIAKRECYIFVAQWYFYIYCT
jgi:hypothetical protein